NVGLQHARAHQLGERGDLRTREVELACSDLEITEQLRDLEVLGLIACDEPDHGCGSGNEFQIGGCPVCSGSSTPSRLSWRTNLATRITRRARSTRQTAPSTGSSAP